MKSTETHRADVVLLHPAAHEMPHKGLKTDNMVRRPQRIAERLVQSHVPGRHSRMADAEDW